MRLVSIAALLCAGLLLAACGGKIKNADSTGNGIIAFGDSITHGTGAGPGEDYPTLLGRALGVQVTNAGVPGETSTDGLARIEQDVLAHRPKLVLIEFGGNDYLKGVPFGETVANTGKMVRLVQGRGAMAAVVALGGMPQMAPYSKEYERIAEENGAIFIGGLLSGILTNPTLKSDEIHPNAAGYKLVAERLEKKLRKYVK